MVTGWRAWAVYPGARLGSAFPGTRFEVWGRGWVNARCRVPHSAPGSDCWCGLHVITDEGEAWDYIGPRHLGGQFVVGRVEVAGVTLPSLVPGDPPSTLRAERARIIGPLVPLPGAEGQAEALRQRYGVTVVDRALAQLHAALS